MLFPFMCQDTQVIWSLQNTAQTSGTYFVSASALLVIDSYDGAAYCYDQLQVPTLPASTEGQAWGTIHSKRASPIRST